MNLNRQTKNQPQPKQPANNGVVVQAHQIEQYSGPVPHPEILQGFKNVDETFPDRIMKMAEQNNVSVIKIAEKTMVNNFSIRKRGQNFAFIIVLLGFALAVFFGYFLKSTAAAITSIIAGIMPLAISGVRGFLKN